MSITHWLKQRYTAAISALGIFWLAWSLYDLAKTKAPLSDILLSPCSNVIFTGSAVAMLYHGVLGMELIIQDYISCTFIRPVMVVMVRGSAFIVGAMAVIASIKIII